MSVVSKIKEANSTLIVDGDLDQVGDYFTQYYSVHLTDRVMKGGHSIVQSVIGALRQSFSDIQIDVDILLDSEDRVAWQRTLRAIHKGKFKNFPASGLQIIWRDIVISQFHDELIS